MTLHYTTPQNATFTTSLHEAPKHTEGPRSVTVDTTQLNGWKEGSCLGMAGKVTEPTKQASKQLPCAMQHERASEQGFRHSPPSRQREGRERCAFQESFLPLDKSISSLEGERERHCSLRCLPALRPRYHSCFRLDGRQAVAQVYHRGLSGWEKVRREGGKGTSEADQYYLFRVGAPSQSGQYGIKGKRPLSLSGIFCPTI